MPDMTAKIEPVIFDRVCLSLDNKPLIKDLSCSLEANGRTILIGPNGAGKSLFLRLLSGLLLPDSGTITRNSPANAPDSYALVFQSPVLLRRSTFDNLAFILKSRKLPKQQINAMVSEALEQARLSDHATTPARRLSGGEQQRLALARALLGNPVTLLLDEPTANLDPASTFIFEEMVLKAERAGTKIVFVTHDIKQAKRLGDDVMFMDNGQILAHKQARQFFREPGSIEAQAYLDGRLP